MPTYDFRCPNGHDFERFFRKISDATVELPCPECGAMAARRVSGGAGLLFKGSGFYITDYGKDGKGPKKAADTSGEAKKGEPSPGTESKPAAAAESSPAKSTDSKGAPEKGSRKPGTSGST